MNNNIKLNMVNYNFVYECERYFDHTNLLNMKNGNKISRLCIYIIYMYIYYTSLSL